MEKLIHHLLLVCFYVKENQVCITYYGNITRSQVGYKNFSRYGVYLEPIQPGFALV